jgi:hypothetical protein
LWGTTALYRPRSTALRSEYRTTTPRTSLSSRRMTGLAVGFAPLCQLVAGFVANDGAILTSPASRCVQLAETPNASVRPEARVRDGPYERAETARKRPQSDAASVFRSRDSTTALRPFRPKLCARRGRPNNRTANCRRRRQRPALQSFAVRQEPSASPLVHTRQTRCSPRA